MPFDPGKGGSNGYNNFHNYSNPYAPQPPAPQKKSNLKPIIFAFAGILVVGLMAGAYLFVSMNNSQSNADNSNSNSVVNDSDYVEVEIFDVEVTE